MKSLVRSIAVATEVSKYSDLLRWPRILPHGQSVDVLSLSMLDDDLYTCLSSGDIKVHFCFYLFSSARGVNDVTEVVSLVRLFFRLEGS